MAATAIELGHEYMVLTDHSARLTVAHGLDEERLTNQLAEIERINGDIAAAGHDFRILTGMEVDILEDGSLDLADAMLARLDVVVASVHSKFRMERAQMTERMLMAVANPHVDILGHCTGRMIGKRPPSQFDADYVFAACAQFGTAVEINCRPERLDPPRELHRRGDRVRLLVLDRLRRPLHRPARVAAPRLRSRRRTRRADRSHRQHAAGSRAARLDRRRVAELTGSGSWDGGAD
jgi:histidinol phosphatase-like PHP family hydrolase